jgi:hypothetical protein
VARSTTSSNFSNTVKPPKKPGVKKIVNNGISSSGYLASVIMSSQPQPITLCSFCLSVLHRGVVHNCTKGQRNENLLELAAVGTPKAKDKLASRIIGEKMRGTSTDA